MWKERIAELSPHPSLSHLSSKEVKKVYMVFPSPFLPTHSTL